MKKIRILSIDGGGIRGIIPAVILAAVEKRIQNITGIAAARLVDYVDFVAGTSTGGIIASALLLPDPLIPGQPKYNASDLVAFYEQHGPDIFKRTMWYKIKSLGGLRDQKYSSKSLLDALVHQFGDQTLSRLLRPCIIPAYDITERKSCFFGSHKAQSTWGEDYKVADIALATSSAPTYFEPALIHSLSGFKRALIDGGVFANNPAMCAYAEARKLKFWKDGGVWFNPTAKDMVMISIGTGSNPKSYSHKRASSWGALRWVRPVVDIMMTGNSETVTHQLRQMFDAADNAGNFIRIDPRLNKGNDAMDDASERNLVNLQLDGYQYCEDDEITIDTIARKLINN